MASRAYGAVVRHDARLVEAALATQFLRIKRGELRKTLGLTGCRLYRALLELERKGILLAEDQGMLSIADRLYELRERTIPGHSNAVENREG